MSIFESPASLVDSSRRWTDALEQRIFREIGVTGTIFAVGSIRRSAATPNSGTFVTRRDTASGLEATATCRITASETRPYLWATPFDLIIPTNWQGIIPVLTFDGSTNSIDTPDAAYWTRADSAWSAGLWVRPAVINAAMSFISKYNNTTGATQIEWDCGMTSSGLAYITVHDDSVPARISRQYSVALTALAWQHLIFVDAGTNASTGLDIYLNGVAVDDTDDDAGAFTKMEDKTGLVRIGCRYGAAAREQFFSGKMAGGILGPFFTQIALTAAQAKNLYLAGADALGL